MKLFAENKKKNLWLIGVLVLSAGGIIYLNFFMGNSRAPVPQTMIDQAFQNSPAPTGAPVGSTTSPSPIGAAQLPSLLPYGDKIDTSIFQLDKYTVLRRPPSLSVSPDELGKENIFE